MVVGQYDLFNEEMDEAIRGVLLSGQYILGQQVERFEQAIADYLGARYCVGVNSGTDALTISLWAAGIRPGDEVILPSLTATATATAVKLAGATPVFADIHPTRMTIDARTIEWVITSKTKAIIPVHLYGRPAPMNQIVALARKYHLAVIEDCAQAHGATIGSDKTGSFGDLAAFSFYPTKNLGGYGDGGMIATGDADLAYFCKELRQYGWDRDRQSYSHHGMNSRLDELQATILSVKLKYLDRMNKRRVEQARIYDRELSGQLLLPMPDSGHVYHQYVAQHPFRDRLYAYLLENNVPAAIHYKTAIHQQPYYRTDISLPFTEQAVQKIISLPIGPHVSEEEQFKVINYVRRFA